MPINGVQVFSEGLNFGVASLFDILFKSKWAEIKKFILFIYKSIVPNFDLHN